MVTQDFTHALAEKIAPALHSLYPAGSTPVLEHEAITIARAIEPLVAADPEEIERHARLAEALMDAIQRALAQLEDGELHEAECILQHAGKGARVGS